MRKLKFMFTLFATAVVSAYVIVSAVMYLRQDGLIFPQTVNNISPSAVVAKPLSLTMQDDTVLHGAVVNPPVGQSSSPTVVLLFGGNAHDVAGFVNYWGTNILPAQSNVIVVGMAYRGYPTFLTPASQGHPSQQALERDAIAIATQLKDIYQPARFVVVGYSLGTAVAAHLAHRLEGQGTPADYLVMISPFTSMSDLAKRQYGYLPIDLLIKHPFATADMFDEITQTPILLLSTPNDGIVPASQTVRLKGLNPKADHVSLPNTTHGDILYHPHLPPLLRHAAGL